MPEVRVEICWEPTLTGVAARLAACVDMSEGTPTAVVPATLRRDDPATREIRSALRARGGRSTVVTPRPAAGLLGGRWRRVDALERSWRIDARLTEGYIAVVTVHPDHARGPFALDLPSRFLHPADRVRVLARPDRARALADIAAAALPARALIVAPVAEGWVGLATADPIAAELWALALAEPHLDGRLEMQGPWEDPTVQRATELELGARIPAEILAELAAPLPSPARDALERAARRLDIRIVARDLPTGNV